MIERKSSRRDVHVPEMAEYKKPVTPTDINVSTPSEFSTSTSIALSELTLTYENEETENMDSKRKVKNLFAEYARASSLHGLSYIGETRRHWIEKLFWTICILVGLSLATTFFMPLYNKWFYHPIIRSIETNNYPIENINFPAVTICSNNKIMESQLNFISEQPPWKNLSEKYFGIQTYLKEAIGKSIMFDIQPHLLLEENEIDDVVKYVLNNHSRDIPEVMKQVMHNCNDMLLMCIWKGEEVDCNDIFSIQKTDNGFCCSFNALKPSEQYLNFEEDEEAIIEDEMNDFNDDYSDNPDNFDYFWGSTESFHGCGGILTEHVGYFSSPQEKETLQCEWLIRAPVGKKIRLNFLSFDLENYEDYKCLDFVSIYDGGSTKFPLLGRYCGFISPPEHISTGNQLLIRFKSEKSLSHEGFRVKYEMFPLDENDDYEAPTIAKSSSEVGINNHGCGGLFHIRTEVAGQISFWHSGGYSNDLHCEWLIEVPEGIFVSVSFTQFNLENDKDGFCVWDYVLIRNGDTNDRGSINTLPVMTKECGSTLPPKFLLRGKQILVVFHSNYENQYRGFKMSFNTMKEGFQIRINIK